MIFEIKPTVHLITCQVFFKINKLVFTLNFDEKKKKCNIIFNQEFFWDAIYLMLVLHNIFVRIHNDCVLFVKIHSIVPYRLARKNLDASIIFMIVNGILRDDLCMGRDKKNTVGIFTLEKLHLIPTYQ